MGWRSLGWALAVLGASLPAVAQTGQPDLDSILSATHPRLEAGKVTGHVVGAKTADCRTVLTLDNGQTYAFDLSQNAVAMNKMLLIGDGDDVIGLTYQGDGASDAALAAEAAIAPLAPKCS